MALDPRETIRPWLPHLLFVGLVLTALVLMAVVASPLVRPVLLAAALAVLTAPVLYDPLHRLAGRILKRANDGTRRQVAGIGAAVALVLILCLPLVLLIGSVSTTLSIARGILLREPAALTQLQHLVAGQIADLDRLFPSLHLAEARIPERLHTALAEVLDFNASFLAFIFAGTGVAAQFVLALIALAFFYAEGSRLAGRLLRFLPLVEADRERLLTRHRQVVLRLLHDTVATALAKGLVLALIAWGIDHLLGTGAVPLIPVAILASVIALLPLVGSALVWLPLAGLEWSLGNHVAAVLLALLCWSADFGLGLVRRRIGKRLDDRDAWIGFLLFIGLVGGLLGFGLMGLAIGPLAVVLVATFGGAWLRFYQWGPEEREETSEDRR